MSSTSHALTPHKTRRCPSHFEKVYREAELGKADRDAAAHCAGTDDRRGVACKHVGWVERNEIHVPERNGGFRRAQPTLRIENLAKIAVLHRPARLGFAERGAGFGEAAQ